MPRMPSDDVRSSGDRSDDQLDPSHAGVKRKKPSSTSSRGVANLTPEQLARKRANDREAQRAIRERTKNQIEHLNARIRELESSQPYHDLQQALREKNAVQAENDEIKRRLASIVGMIQPLLGTQGLNGKSLSILLHTAVQGSALTLFHRPRDCRGTQCAATTN
jgi:hypothetical protein